jgi:hypothetical protein
MRLDDGDTTTILDESPSLDEGTLYELEIEWHDGSGSESADTHVISIYTINETDLSRTGTVASYSAIDPNHTANTGIGWVWNSETQQTGTKTVDRYRVIGNV